MRFLLIKKWEEFQHYKDRNPPWIKLHRALLDDHTFYSLPDEMKAHLMLIWVVASQSGGRIPEDPKFIAEKIGAKKRPRLDELIASGFLIPEQVASTTLAPRKHDDSESLSLARSREAEERTTTSEAEERQSARDPRKTRLPKGFAISERVRDWAAREGHSRLEERFAHFVSKARAKGYTYIDWDEGFMGAIRDDWAKLGKPGAGKLSPVGQRSADNLNGWLNDGTNGP